MAQMGRIGGPLLADNLLRNGKNLAFETNLLYFDVVNGRVGVKSSSPVNNLYVTTDIGTIDILVDTLAELGNISFSTHEIQNPLSTITISPNQASNPTITAPTIRTANLSFNTNLIENILASDDINFQPSGTGQIKLNNNVEVTGYLHATGNITFDGNVTFGNDTTDTINFAARVSSSILPNQDDTYTLGSSSNYWNTLYTNNMDMATITQDSLSATTLNSGNISISGTTITALGNLSLDATNVNFNGFKYISENTISYPDITSAFLLETLGNGYLRFGGSTGLVMPQGTPDTYPSNAETGTVRFNTSTKELEVFNRDVSNWLPAIGISPVISQAEVENLVTVYTVVLGF
jgi:hypothetical protein